MTIQKAVKGKKTTKKTIKSKKKQPKKLDNLLELANKEIDSIRSSENSDTQITKVDLKLDSIDKNLSRKEMIQLLARNIKSEILSDKTSEISDLSKDVKRQLGYIGFVFYVWNPNNLNIKIIPLTNVNPVLDITNTKEFYYLYRPALFIDGKPIFLIIRGIPISFELKLIKDNSNLIQSIELAGYTPQEIRAKLKSGHSTYIFGKPNLSLSQLLWIIFLMVSICLIEYIVISSIFLGG